jgi:hypothetical protein
MGALLGLALTVGLRAQQPMDAGQDGSQDPTQVSPAADPPSRVARLSFAQGNVSAEPASVNEFSPAEVNYPLTTGDRVWSDSGALAELEAGQLALRMGQTTDLTVTAMTDTLAQFGLGQGSVHLRSYALDPGTTTELDTPNVAVTVLQPGDVRVDVDPNGDVTTVTLLSGQVEVDGNGVQQVMQPGQSVRLTGTDPVAAQWVQPPGADALDNFSQSQDQAYQSEESQEQSYVNPDTVGAADLAQNGTWSPESDYGDVWFPTGVAAGWQPYSNGRWTWVAPWGWTWIESERWGFAPFHYGRWAIFGGRWGWVPGPPVVHPVYAPALVVFVHPGQGSTAWFPLGPNEPYAPWYHSSALYENRVNVSNIYSRNANQVRTVYNTSNREMYANALGGQRQFTNRDRATVAVSQANFAAGRPVRTSMMHLQPQQLAGAQVVPHPMVTPERTMVSPGTARAVPPRVGRPTLTSHEDAAIRAGSTPRTQPNQPAGGSSAPSGQPAPIERRGFQGAQPSQQPGYRGNPATGTQPQSQPQHQQPTYRNNPANGNPASGNPSNGAQQSGQQNYRNRPAPVTQPATAAQPAPGTQLQPQGQPTYRNNPGAQPNGQQSPGMTIQGGVRPSNGVRGTEQLPSPGAPAPRAQTPQGQEQRLYNRAVPPPTRPSFEQQRQAIQSTDPGRPLSPQQLDNLHENRPAGQPQMREAAPHPMPQEQRSAPPPQPQQQRSSPPPRSDNNRH